MCESVKCNEGCKQCVIVNKADMEEEIEIVQARLTFAGFYISKYSPCWS